MSVKGDWPRPCSTTREERDLRMRYMYGEITREQFDGEYSKLKEQGLIQRNGRIIK